MPNINIVSEMKIKTTIRHHFIPMILAIIFSKKKTTRSVVKDMEKSELSYIAFSLLVKLYNATAALQTVWKFLKRMNIKLHMIPF